MSLAEWIWRLSWSLCALAAIILAGLILYRPWANRRSRNRLHERERQTELLKARSELPSANSRGAAGNALTDLAVDLLELVRGDEKDGFAHRMAEAGVAARLRLRLRRGGVQTRILAASALENFEDRETQSALTAALDDRDREVRLTAALSLAVRGSLPPAREVIRRLGIGERETSLRTVMLLVDLAQADVEDVRSLLTDPAIAPPVKAAAAEALARCDDFAAVPVVAKLVMSVDRSARELRWFLGALARFEHPAGSAAIQYCLGSPAAEVRAAAALAAGRILVATSLDRLEQLLGDPDWWVRFEAAQALLRFDDRGHERLRRAADGSEEPARETAALTLAEQAGAG